MGTFEYLNIPSSFEKKIIPKNDMFFYHSNFLENKKDRYPFDIKFLKLSIQEKKNIARNTFYLANCYFRQKEYKDALEYYIKRTKYFFSNHELWFCYYQMGKIYNFFKKKEKAIDAFLQAITYHPNRIENIYEIIKIYRLLDYPIIGMSFYK